MKESLELLSKIERDDSWTTYPEKVPSWANKGLDEKDFGVCIYFLILVMAIFYEFLRLSHIIV